MTTTMQDLTPPDVQRPTPQSDRPMEVATPTVLIVADSASMKMGGEAALPVHWFRVLRQRGVDAYLVTHERTRRELFERFPDDHDRMTFVRDTAVHRALSQAAKIVPPRVQFFTFMMVLRILVQRAARKLAKQVIRDKAVDVVHIPSPVSPKDPSMMHGLGVPVIFGPMNGGMVWPENFHQARSGFLEVVFAAGRKVANLFTVLMPGKRRAAMLVVANPRTAGALPRNCTGEVVELVENGVDLKLWQPVDWDAKDAARPARFVWMGRMVDWKAVDILLRSFAKLKQLEGAEGAVLELIGSGPMRDELEALADQLGLKRESDIVFSGWLPQDECAAHLRDADALVLSSLLECGGAVVLEAMAIGLPAVATAWGGPLDYIVDGQTGLTVPVEEPEQLERDFALAMQKLAVDGGLRRQMGEAGRQRVAEQFDWDAKAEVMLGLYRRAMLKSEVTSSRP